MQSVRSVSWRDRTEIESARRKVRVWLVDDEVTVTEVLVKLLAAAKGIAFVRGLWDRLGHCLRG